MCKARANTDGRNGRESAAMRKTLAHKLLVQEVMTQLRFALTNADLKRRIDSLIEREFLERSAADSQVYNYLA